MDADNGAHSRDLLRSLVRALKPALRPLLEAVTDNERAARYRRRRRRRRRRHHRCSRKLRHSRLNSRPSPRTFSIYIRCICVAYRSLRCRTVGYRTNRVTHFARALRDGYDTPIQERLYCVRNNALESIKMQPEITRSLNTHIASRVLNFIKHFNL